MLNRGLTLAALAAAIVVAAIVMFRTGGESYTLKARFENAGQTVKGGLVEISGRRVGNITDLELGEDGVAELTLEIDDDHAPVPRGTHAQIRQFGLSGPASRYVELQLPTGEERGPNLPDGALLDLDQTTANVELDEVFSIFDPKTRDSLRGVIRGSERQHRGQGRAANAGWLYLDPALVASSRLFSELNRDTPELERFIVSSSRLVGDIAERREDLAELVPNLAETTGAIARPPGALADAISQLPPFMRRANTTYVNLRGALDDLDPLVEEAKPVARKLRPYVRELRLLTGDARPTLRDLAKITRRPGRANDLVELARSMPALRNIAVGPVRANGKDREGALPAAAEAIGDSVPRLTFARPYAVDLTGWFDDFSHTGLYDALGSFSRTGTHANLFSVRGGALTDLLSPLQRSESLGENLTVGQNNRCPGSLERDPGDGSTPWRPTPGFNCDPRQLPPGP